MKGYLDFGSLFIALIGIVLCGYAGYLKDADTKVVNRAKEGFLEIINDPEDSKNDLQNRQFIFGIVLSIFSGMFSAGINVAYALGNDIIDKSTGPEIFKFAPIQALTIPIGGFVNIIYSLWLIHGNNSFHQIFDVPDFFLNTLKCCISAILWYGAMFLYGMACNYLGDLGVVIGFPIYIGLTICFSNIAAYFYFKEWDQTSNKTRRYLLLGNIVIIISVALIGLANEL